MSDAMRISKKGMNAGAMDCKVRRNPAVQRCGYVGPYAVFDITGNHFRIFTVIHHKRQKLCIREVCAPAEYVQGNKAKSVSRQERHGLQPQDPCLSPSSS